ncbi:hypothetical protein CALVIDRAFT_558377 [Calocera viscosa TUFC12733]|uniref:Concanavalin A-like lectin/glucanase n=1 Tax=Calocera viscosa (strain TUFC12733) TaxID=1330018 RepID=A0A167GX46_CALVF|nr:hypothetical protein CALVIDRAFT_558377 [Calocera viscosa TUFC12733]
MLSLILIVALPLLVGFAQAISLFPTCGFFPNGGGSVQPTLGWHGPKSKPINPDPPFPKVWAMNLGALPWSATSANQYLVQESGGIWVDEGAEITSYVAWENEAWVQAAYVLSGAATGQHVWMTTPASYFLNTSSGDDNTVAVVCVAEQVALTTCPETCRAADDSPNRLFGDNVAQYRDFTVTFTNVVFRAAKSDGVATLCASARDESDDEGGIRLAGFSMLDQQTCYWESIMLIPPS